MRTGIPILVSSLALTVFLTSLVLESMDTPGNHASMGVPELDVVPAGVHAPQRSEQSEKESMPLSTEQADRASALVSKAAKFQKSGNTEGARRLYVAAVKVDPSNLEARKNLGMLCLLTGRYQQSEKHLREFVSVELDPDGRFRFELGLAQMRQGKYGIALENLTVAARRNPGSGSRHFALACVLSRLMETDRALVYLELAYAKMGTGILAHIADPALDNLRESKQFQEILRSARSRHIQNYASLVKSPKSK